MYRIILHRSGERRPQEICLFRSNKKRLVPGLQNLIIQNWPISEKVKIVMNTQVKKTNHLQKHPLPQRIMHWFNALSFLFLWLTGIGLVTSDEYRLAPVFFTDFMAWLFNGPANLLHAHIGVGFLWFTVLGIAFVIDPWGLGLRFIRDLRLTSNDFTWFRKRIHAELDNKISLPPQGAYNAGQKAFGWTVVFGVPAIGFTGIFMVIGTGGGPISQWMVFLHLIAVGAVIAFLIVHLSMALLMTEERPALKSMFSGDVDEDYAKHHHEEWYKKFRNAGGEPVNPLERFGILKASFRTTRKAWNYIISRPEKPLWSPYAAGFLIGLAVLTAFLLFGHGLGASGLFSRIGANFVALFAEDHVRNNAFWGPSIDESFRHYWLLWLGIGTLAGGFISSALGGRIRSGIDHGELISPRTRIFLAIFGGALVGFATRMTRGCTSHLALSGGSLLGTGSWIFVLSVFGGGFLTAFLIRRVWR